MRFILKERKNEPSTLKAYRSTPNTTYVGFADTDKLLKKALCKEQGFICCYCMRRITEDKITVEHYITQKRHKDSPYTEAQHRSQELQYMNMLASCNDMNRNCSGIRGNLPLALDVCVERIKIQIGYQKNGVVYATGGNIRIQKDLENLRLGTTAKGISEFVDKSEYWLIENRKIIINKVKSSLDRNGWTKATISNEIKKWQSLDTEGYLQEYCQVAISYLNSKLKKLS